VSNNKTYTKLCFNSALKVGKAAAAIVVMLLLLLLLKGVARGWQKRRA